VVHSGSLAATSEAPKRIRQQYLSRCKSSAVMVRGYGAAIGATGIGAVVHQDELIILARLGRDRLQGLPEECSLSGRADEARYDGDERLGGSSGMRHRAVATRLTSETGQFQRMGSTGCARG
jgi:hypothetical protein